MTNINKLAETAVPWNQNRSPLGAGPIAEQATATITRKQTQLLIARQIGIHDGYTWQVAPHYHQQKKQDALLALAGSILATVERAAVVTW